MRSLLLVLSTLAFICSPSVVEANAVAPSPTDVASHATQAGERSSVAADVATATLSASPRCRYNPVACIADVMFAWLIAPAVDFLVTHVISDFRVFGALDGASDVGVRLGRTFTYESSYSPLVFPYVAVGARLQQNDPAFSRFFGSTTKFLETTVGARTHLDTWHPAPAAWVERLHVTTEVQWLRNRSRADQLWVEVAPGVDLFESLPTARLYLSANVPVTGDPRPTVRPGIGVEVWW